MKKVRFKLTPAVYALFVKENEVLLMRRYNTGYQDGFYGLPAGHLDGNESAKHAMIREINEEVGVKIKENSLKFALIMHRNCIDYEYIDLFFIVNKWEGNFVIMEPNKCDEFKWFPINNLPENTIEYIKDAVKCYLNKQNYCELGWE